MRRSPRYGRHAERRRRGSTLPPATAARAAGTTYPASSTAFTASTGIIGFSFAYFCFVWIDGVVLELQKQSALLSKS